MLEIDMVDGIAVVRPRGQRLFGQAVTEIGEAIETVCARRVPSLLVDIRGLSGFAPPSLADRAGMVRRWAAVANGRVRVAMVAPPEYIDPERFGIVVAAHYGLPGAVFLDEAEALAWLRDGQPIAPSQDV